MTALQKFLLARDFLLQHRSDYVTAYRDFAWPELDEFNWALDYFDVIAADNQQPALWVVNEDGSEQKLSFAEMALRSNRTANFLRQLGVVRQDRILLMLGNEVPLWEIMLASIKLGAVIIPASTLLTEDDLRDRIERGQVRHVVTSSAHVGKFEAIGQIGESLNKVCVDADVPGWTRYETTAFAETFTPQGLTFADDPMLLYFTSGTTALPKLVMHTHQSYPVGHLSTMYWIGLQPGDIHLNISSPGWAKHAWSCFFAPWNAGACVFIFNYARFNARSLLNVLASHRVTSLCAPPTVWRMMIQEDLAAHRDRLHLREVIGAGEPLNPEIIAQVQRAWHITLRDGYGQTETTAQIGNTPGQPLKPGSMGRPLPGYRVALLDADGVEDRHGEISLSLAHRHISLMSGYIDSSDKTAEAMRNNHYHTGDIASRDDDGYITYIGRADDVFKASDYRISPFELESVLMEHPLVAEAAVVPSPDAIRTAVPKAFVMLKNGQQPSAEVARDILTFAAAHLAPYKRIRKVEFADLPKTISGKIRRVQLRVQEAERVARGERAEMEFWEGDFGEGKG